MVHTSYIFQVGVHMIGESCMKRHRIRKRRGDAGDDQNDDDYDCEEAQ